MGILRKKYGRDLDKETKTLEKIDFKHKKAILDLYILISRRISSVFEKFLKFKVSNKKLRVSKGSVFQRRLGNLERIEIEEQEMEIETIANLTNKLSILFIFSLQIIYYFQRNDLTTFFRKC